MKKSLLVALSLVLVGGVLVGCSNKEEVKVNDPWEDVDKNDVDLTGGSDRARLRDRIGGFDEASDVSSNLSYLFEFDDMSLLTPKGAKIRYEKETERSYTKVYEGRASGYNGDNLRYLVYMHGSNSDGLGDTPDSIETHMESVVKPARAEALEYMRTHLDYFNGVPELKDLGSDLYKVYAGGGRGYCQSGYMGIDIKDINYAYCSLSAYVPSEGDMLDVTVISKDLSLGEVEGMSKTFFGTYKALKM